MPSTDFFFFFNAAVIKFYGPLHEEIINLFCGGINNYTHTSRDVASQSSAKEAANYCSGRFINRADINLLAGFSIFFDLFFPALPALHPFSWAIYFSSRATAEQALSITKTRAMRCRVLARSCKRRFVATLTMFFRRRGGENQGGCEADTKGRANTWLEELSLTLAEGTGTLCDIARRRGLAKTAFQQTKWGKIEIEFFFPIPGSSDGTLAHFFFLLKSVFTSYWSLSALDNYCIN